MTTSSQQLDFAPCILRKRAKSPVCDLTAPFGQMVLGSGRTLARLFQKLVRLAAQRLGNPHDITGQASLSKVQRNLWNTCFATGQLTATIS